LPGVHPLRNLYGVSFAVANMSGFVARACQMAKGQAGVTIDGILRQQVAPISLRPSSPETGGNAVHG
jgi:hypothetical protein